MSVAMMTACEPTTVACVAAEETPRPRGHQHDPLTPAQQRLVADNVGLAHLAVAKVWHRPDVRRLGNDHALSVSYEGLMRASRCWIPTRSKFSTYATWSCMRNVVTAARRADVQRAKSVKYRRLSDRLAPPSPACHTVEEHELLCVAMLAAAEAACEPRGWYVLLETVVNGRTLQAVGDELGVSKERVRQVRLRALRVARRAAEGVV